MKQTIFLIIIIFFAHADFLLNQQTIYLSEGKAEAGLRFEYSYDEWSQTVTLDDLTRRQSQFILFGKYVLLPDVEISASLPYTQWKQTQTNNVDRSAEGAGIASVGLKHCFYKEPYWKNALFLNCELPSGDSTKQLGEGLNFELTGISQLEMNPLSIIINASYKYTGVYLNTNRVNVDTGNLIKAGVSFQYPILPDFYLQGEGSFSFFGNYFVENVEVNNTGGSIIDVSGGLRVALKDTEFKLGIIFSIGDINFRPYMYKIVIANSTAF